MTNKLKCPVCGEGMKSEKGKPVLICRNNKCEFLGIMWPIKSIEAMNTLIQSRIDKEKAAAVQEERERVEGLIEGQLTNAQEGAENYPEGSKAQFASAKLMNTLQWLRDKISEGRINENNS